MTLTLNSRPGTKIELPIHYNQYVQAALYQLLEPLFAAFLHDQGFQYEKRVFRLFSFSRLLGTYQINRSKGLISFESPVRLVVISPVQPFSESVVNSIVRDEGFRIGPQALEVTNVRTEISVASGPQTLVRTLSPIVTYSTMTRADGRKFTYYFEPGEKDFALQIRENLRRKYFAFQKPREVHNQEAFSFNIQPQGRIKQHLVMYRQTVIKGYSGHFLLSGDPEFLQFALDVGLGAKGAQGFGTIEAVNQVK